LAALLTSGLARTVVEAFNSQNRPEDLKGPMKVDKAIVPEPGLYVDVGRLVSISKSLSTNTLILAHAYRIVDDWLTDRGMAGDRDKMELTHHTWRTPESDTIPATSGA